MKKLLIAVSALAALSLLAPSTGFAEATNILSLYADEAGTENTLTMSPYSQVDIYLVVTNPYNTIRDSAIEFLGGVEFAVPAPTNAIVLSWTWPVDVTDVGTGDSHIVGFGQSLPVVDGSAVVCTLNILYNSASSDPGYFTLAPSDPASNPGFMACLDWANEGDIISLTPPFESFDYHVLAINDVVATERATMDAVKALYR